MLLIGWLLMAFAENETLFQKAPADWVGEVIPFPIGFAPDIDLEGVEELRFAPGWRDAESAEYFTYSFIWWLDGDPDISPNALQGYLLDYYRGLYNAVSKREDKNTDEFTTNLYATRERAWVPGASANYRAEVSWVDPFVTEKPLTFEMMICSWTCPKQNKTAVFFLVAPKGTGPDAWEKLRGLRAGACD